MGRMFKTTVDFEKQFPFDKFFEMAEVVVSHVKERLETEKTFEGSYLVRNILETVGSAFQMLQPPNVRPPKKFPKAINFILTLEGDYSRVLWSFNNDKERMKQHYERRLASMCSTLKVNEMCEGSLKLVCSAKRKPLLGMFRKLAAATPNNDGSLTIMNRIVQKIEITNAVIMQAPNRLSLMWTGGWSLKVSKEPLPQALEEPKGKHHRFHGFEPLLNQEGQLDPVLYEKIARFSLN